MHLSTIVCLDDLVRDDDWPASEFCLDLVRLPIFHATGINVGKTPHRGQTSNLLRGFSVEQFRALCARDAALPLWHSLHHQIPDSAAAYLLQHLPEQALVLCHQMPPWLMQRLDAAGVPWVDLRLSPLRFGADLVMGLATNLPSLHAAAADHAMNADELVADAKLMSARMRLRRRQRAQLRLPSNPCVFIGQAEDDPALIGKDGLVARATDHAVTLHRLARTGPMMYLPHPQAGDFARIEHESMERITGHRVPICTLDGYELLACDDELTLVGLNAGLLQEAVWFARVAYALCPEPTKPVFGDAHQPGGYLQIASHVLLSEPLWASALGGVSRARPLQMPARANQLRELMNNWWGYAEATQRGSEHLRAGFALAGGQGHTDALRRCEGELGTTRTELKCLRQELDELRAQLRDTAALASAAAAASQIMGHGARSGGNNASPDKHKARAA